MINNAQINAKLQAQAEKESWANQAGGQDVAHGLVGGAIAYQQQPIVDLAAQVQNQIAYHEKELVRLDRLRSLLDVSPEAKEALKLFHGL